MRSLSVVALVALLVAALVAPAAQAAFSGFDVYWQATLFQGVPASNTLQVGGFVPEGGASVNVSCVAGAGATGTVTAQPATVCIQGGDNLFALTASRDAAGTFTCSLSPVFGPQAAELSSVASMQTIEIRAVTPYTVAASATSTLAAPLRLAVGTQLHLTFTPSGPLGEDVPLEVACSSFVSIDSVQAFAASEPDAGLDAKVTIGGQQLGRAVCTFKIGDEYEYQDTGKLRNTLLAPLYLEIVPTVPLTFTGPAAAVRPLPSAGNPVTLQYSMTTPAGITDPAGLTALLQCSASPAVPLTYGVTVSAGSTIVVGNWSNNSDFKFARFNRSSTGTVTWTLQVQYSAKLLGSAVSVDCYVLAMEGDSLFSQSSHITLLLGAPNPLSSLNATAPATVIAGVECPVAVSFAAGLAVPDWLILHAILSSGLEIDGFEMFHLTASPQQSTDAFLFVGQLPYDDVDSLDATITFALGGADAPLYRAPVPIPITIVRAPQLVVTGLPAATGNAFVAGQPTIFSASIQQIVEFPKDGEVGTTLTCTGATVSVSASVTSGATGFSTAGLGQVTFDQTANTGAAFAISVDALAAGEAVVVRCTWSDLTGSLAAYFRAPLPFSFRVGQPVQLTTAFTQGSAILLVDDTARVTISSAASAVISGSLTVSASCTRCVPGVSRTVITDPDSISPIGDFQSGFAMAFRSYLSGNATCVFSLSGDDAPHFIAPASIDFQVYALKQLNVTATGGILSPIARTALSPEESVTSTLIPFGSNLTVTVQAPRLAAAISLSCVVIAGEVSFPVTVVDTGASGLTASGSTAEWTAESAAAATWTLAVPALSESDKSMDQQVQCYFTFETEVSGFQLPPMFRFAMGSPLVLGWQRHDGEWGGGWQTDPPVYVYPYDPLENLFQQWETDWTFLPEGAVPDLNSYVKLSPFYSVTECTRDAVTDPHSTFYFYSRTDGPALSAGRALQYTLPFTTAQGEWFGVIKYDDQDYVITCTFGAPLPNDNGLPSRYTSIHSLNMTSVKPNREFSLSGSAIAAVPGAAQHMALDAVPDLTIALPAGTLTGEQSMVVVVHCDGSTPVSFSPAPYRISEPYNYYSLTASNPSISLNVTLPPLGTDSSSLSASYQCAVVLQRRDGSTDLAELSKAYSFKTKLFRLSLGTEAVLTVTQPRAIVANNWIFSSAQAFFGSVESSLCAGSAVGNLQARCDGPDPLKTYATYEYDAVVQFVDGHLTFPGKVGYFIRAADVGDYRCIVSLNNWQGSVATAPIADLVFTVLPQSTFTVSGVPALVTTGSTFAARIAPSVSLLAPTGGVTVEFSCTDASDTVQLYFAAGSTSADYQEVPMTLRTPTTAVSSCAIRIVNLLDYNADPNDVLTSASAFQFKPTSMPLNFGPLRSFVVSAPAVDPCATAAVTASIAPSSTDLSGSITCSSGLLSQDFTIRAGVTQVAFTFKAPSRAVAVTCTATIQQGQTGSNFYPSSATAQLIVGAPLIVTLTPPARNAGLVAGATTDPWTLSTSSPPTEPITIGVYAPGAVLSQSVFEFSSGVASGTFTISLDAAFAASLVPLSFSVDAINAPFVTIPADRQLLVSTFVAFNVAYSVGLSTNTPVSFTVSPGSTVRLPTNITVSCNGLAAESPATVSYAVGTTAGTNKFWSFRTSAVSGSAMCALTASDLGAPFAKLVVSSVTLTWTAPSGPGNGTDPSSSGGNSGAGGGGQAGFNHASAPSVNAATLLATALAAAILAACL